eukprot:GHRR01012092.1.p1 GENE.GHRR01012092.1~~GHRR01012092.1.p1  ORF type:complete len:174 (+),score=62.93 GHRR01012092.1:452-973(+)
MSTDLDLYQRLNLELVALVDHFTNLVKATREGLDADESGGEQPRSGPGIGSARERRLPGELLEVMVEKLLAAGHQCIHTVAQLKKGAMTSDFNTLMANLQSVSVALQQDTHNILSGLDHIKRDAECLLTELEQHYYSSAHKGQLPHPPGHQTTSGSSKLAELCQQAMEITDSR